jgi:hypothetical protein
MKKSKIIFNLPFVLVLMLTMLLLGACDEKEYSEDYDVPWPVPSIASFSPTEAMIESEITITGVNLDKTNRVTIGTQEAEILSVSATQVVVKVPRLASTDRIKLTTKYKREALSELKFVAQYPKAQVLEWPSKIVRGRNFTIKGDNVDLITKVSVADQDISVDGSKGNKNEVTVSVATIDLSAVESAVIVIKSAKGGVEGTSTSPSIPVEDPTNIINAKPAIKLFDFENNVNPFVSAGDLSPVSGIDAGGVKKAFGAHYLTVKASNVSSWKDVGYIEIPAAVDLSQFSKPHISFLINTNGKAGYFQLEDGQGNWYHFKKDPDNYMFATDGWEWRSYDLNQVDDGKPFDLANVKAKLMFKTGNIASGDFEINIDQVMFTDGAVNITKVLFDFEDGVNPYSGSASSSIKSGGAVPSIEGNNYLSVTKANVAKYEWTGDIASYESVDLSDYTDPHLSFWINTGSASGNLQVEVVQAGTKWGSNPFAAESNEWGGYAVKTEGEWKLYSFRMSELLTSKWEGSGTAFDPKGVLDYIKIGFSSSNIDNAPYEVNIDHVVISDGKVF